MALERGRAQFLGGAVDAIVLPGGVPHNGLTSTSPRAQPENEPPAEAKGPIWEEDRFPVTTYADPGSNVFGIGIVARQEAFMVWARQQDASLFTDGKVHYTEEEWMKEASKFVGMIRHNPKNECFKYSCEFWTPWAQWTISSREKSAEQSTGNTLSGG